MALKLLCEINEEINLVTESAEDGKKSYFIEGVFLQSNLKNRNGRIYPKEILQKELENYNENYVKKKRAYGELGHPSNPTINLDRVSHIVTSLREEGDNFIGKAKIMDTPNGRIVKNLMDEGCKLGVSSRGLGSLQERNGAKYVSDDFYLTTAGDIVADPSAPHAFVENIMENVGWIQQGNVWVPVVEQEQTVNNDQNLIDKINELNEQIAELRENTKKKVKKNYKKKMTTEEKQELFISLFENYIKKLSDNG